LNRFARPAIVFVLLASVLFAGQRSADEKELWSLEKAYWDYVQANDLERYRALWDADCLAWPPTIPDPVRKDHVTDWITAHTSKGETLKSYDLEPLAVKVTDNIATTMYRVRLTWVNKNGTGQPATLRIIHTLRRNAGGTWQIVSAVGAPPTAEGR
jgi:ketosteroid isomerase-like protein